MSKWLGNLYDWFWFHTEFALTLTDRRPYTFIMRDWIYQNLVWALVLIMCFYAGMIILSLWHGTLSTVISSAGSFVLAHVVWGSKWIEGQQEYPEYLG